MNQRMADLVVEMKGDLLAGENRVQWAQWCFHTAMAETASPGGDYALAKLCEVTLFRILDSLDGEQRG